VSAPGPPGTTSYADGVSRQLSGDISASRLSNLTAHAIAGAHELHRQDFEKITRRAATRFQRRDWQGAVEDAAERLDLYGQMIDRTEREVRVALGERVADAHVWAGTKAVYSGLIAGRDDWELAETFFNSVTRRIFTTLGVNPEIEFVDSDFEPPAVEAARQLCRTYEPVGEVAELIERVLADFSWGVPYADRAADAALAAGRISAQLRASGCEERL